MDVTSPKMAARRRADEEQHGEVWLVMVGQRPIRELGEVWSVGRMGHRLIHELGEVRSVERLG
jgi:hypothetical protein